MHARVVTNGSELPASARRRGLVRTLGRAAAVAASVVLVGCVATPEPAPTGTASPSVSASPSAPAEDAPEFIADGSADDNLPYFDSVNSTFLASSPTPGGRPIIDNLVAAGFDRAAMQVTGDTTAIGGAVDSVQFSVRMADRCLIGQATASGYVGTVGPVVGDSCLIGNTRPIDW